MWIYIPACGLALTEKKHTLQKEAIRGGLVYDLQPLRIFLQHFDFNAGFMVVYKKLFSEI